MPGVLGLPLSGLPYVIQFIQISIRILLAMGNDCRAQVCVRVGRARGIRAPRAPRRKGWVASLPGRRLRPSAADAQDISLFFVPWDVLSLGCRETGFDLFKTIV